MSKTSKKKISNMLSKIRRSDCSNNTQRVALALLKASTKDGWVSRANINVPSVTSRIRDLRKERFGSFRIECSTAKELNKKVKSPTDRPTFYRIDPSTVTVSAVQTIFEGVISA